MADDDIIVFITFEALSEEVLDTISSGKEMDLYFLCMIRQE
jgi:hypothetical protein